MDVEAIIDEFREHLETRDLSDDVIQQYPVYIKALSTYVEGDLLGINEDVLVRYIAHLKKNKVKPSSIRRYFAVFNTFFEFLVFKKYITVNPITPMFKKLYLKSRKSHDVSQRRQCPTVEQVRLLVQGILDPKELAVVVLLAKTGMLRHEVSELDVSNLDLKEMVIHVQPTGKRSNEILYYDLETSIVLDRWLCLREKLNKKKIKALFLDHSGNRLSGEAINEIVVKHAIAVGLHDPTSKQLNKRLTAHSLRHYFSTRMGEAGMPRNFVMELRGDSPHDAIDLYTHIDKKELQQSYLDYAPELGLI
jgi:site-specific recombinase XerD